MRFEFDWDPAKAESNRRKHGVSFEDAMGVFGDPLARSLLDNDSGQGESAMGYHRPKPRQQSAAGRAHLCRTVPGAGGDTHHFGSPADRPRIPPIRGRVIR
jgi:hypothetical protein